MGDGRCRRGRRRARRRPGTFGAVVAAVRDGDGRRRRGRGWGPAVPGKESARYLRDKGEEAGDRRGAAARSAVSMTSRPRRSQPSAAANPAAARP